MPSPTLTISRSSFVSSTDTHAAIDLDAAKLETLLKNADGDLSSVVEAVNDVLEESDIKAPYDQGWYQPNSSSNRFSRRLEPKLEGKKLDDLVQEFFHRDESRAVYGDRVIIPRRPVEDISASDDPTLQSALDPGQRIKEEDKKTTGHRKNEEKRRIRHRELQQASHIRCPAIAAECGAEQAQADKETRSQAGKGPGKDDQLCASIFTQEMAGRTVQALNDRCKYLESLLQLLLKCLPQNQDPLVGAKPTQLRSPDTERTSPVRSTYVGVKRSRDEMEGVSWQARTRGQSCEART